VPCFPLAAVAAVQTAGRCRRTTCGAGSLEDAPDRRSAPAEVSKRRPCNRSLGQFRVGAAALRANPRNLLMRWCGRKSPAQVGVSRGVDLRACQVGYRRSLAKRQRCASGPRQRAVSTRRREAVTLLLAGSPPGRNAVKSRGLLVRSHHTAGSLRRRSFRSFDRHNALSRRQGAHAAPYVDDLRGTCRPTTARYASVQARSDRASL
jgi:hypothetical protein